MLPEIPARSMLPTFDSAQARIWSAGRTECRSVLRPLTSACRSRMNADDRLPVDPLGRIEGGDGVVEGRDVADVRPQPSVTHPPDDFTQLDTIGLDNEVDRQTVG